MPACTAVGKSTIHCKSASTTEPVGNAPLLGVRLTASGTTTGLLRYRLDWPPETSTTVHASGRASATAGFSQEELRRVTVGNTGAGTGAVPLGVGATGCCARLVGVSCKEIHAARCGP